MLFTITTHLLDILQADPRLIAGGAAYAAGWPGVKRPDKDQDKSTPGWVNLYDSAYKKAGANHRPGIYIGTAGLGLMDRREFPAMNSGASGARQIEFRIVCVPFIIATRGQGIGAEQIAREQRDELRASIQRILIDHRVESGYWYGLACGVDVERDTLSVSGSGAQAEAEAFGMVTARIRYSFSDQSPS